VTVPGFENAFRSVIERGRRREGAWFDATLLDGSPVSLVALSRSLSDKIADFAAFSRQMDLFGQLRIEGVARPLLCGTNGGIVHCAYERPREVQDLPLGPRPPAEVAAIGASLARAVAAIHRAGLLHGALSTAHVQQTVDGIAVTAVGLHAALCAGGLAGDAAAAALSDPSYLSPECRGGGVLDSRSDVYALGAVLYELITGKPPFGGRTTSYLMASVLSESEALEAVPGTINPVVEAVLRAVEQSPEDRWPTAAAFAQALSAAAGSEDTTKGRSLRDIFTGAWFSARRSRE